MVFVFLGVACFSKTFLDMINCSFINMKYPFSIRCKLLLFILICRGSHFQKSSLYRDLNNTYRRNLSPYHISFITRYNFIYHNFEMVHSFLEGKCDAKKNISYFFRIVGIQVVCATID